MNMVQISASWQMPDTTVICSNKLTAPERWLLESQSNYIIVIPTPRRGRSVLLDQGLQRVERKPLDPQSLA